MVQCPHMAGKPGPPLSRRLAMFYRPLGIGHHPSLRTPMDRVEVHQVSRLPLILPPTR
jgi:hypothetical protein